jgi:hypothetical protein
VIEIRLDWIAKLDASSQHVMVAASSQPIHDVPGPLAELRLVLRALVWINTASHFNVMDAIAAINRRGAFDVSLGRSLTLHETRTMIRALRLVAANHPHDLVRVWAVEQAAALYRLLDT